MNDGTAQMGFQVGKSAMMAGQEYMEQNVRIPGNSVLIDAYLLLKIIVQSLYFHTGSEALLQRLQLLRPEQDRPRPLPLATQALVSPAGSNGS